MLSKHLYQILTKRQIQNSRLNLQESTDFQKPSSSYNLVTCSNSACPSQPRKLHRSLGSAAVLREGKTCSRLCCWRGHITWTPLFADLSSQILNILGELLEAVPIGHHFYSMQQHICLELKKVVLIFFKHQHVMFQIHFVLYCVKKKSLEYLVTQSLSTTQKQKRFGSV